MSPPTPNPFSVAPGRELNIRTFLHDEFERAQAAGRHFDPNDWSRWSRAQVAQAIRAQALDYLTDHGNGHDWITCSWQAEVMLASNYHAVAHESGNIPAPQLRLNFFDPDMEEGFDLTMEPPLELKADPIPGAPPPPVVTQSQRVRARLMVAPSGDCLRASDDCLWTGADQMRQFFQNYGRLPLIFMGASLAVWKSFQVTHVIRGGSMVRGIRIGDKPSIPEGQMRLLFSRTGPKMDAAVNADPEGAALLLG